jgi:hypothetical protein
MSSTPRVLISQKLYAELQKVGFDNKTLDSLNDNYIKRVGGIGSAAGAIGMTLDEANQVVR